jgi:hypothetical protein
LFFSSGLDLPAEDERGVPVPEAVLDADAGRAEVQLPGPHQRDARAGQAQPSEAPEVCAEKNTPIVELVASPERVHGLVVAGPQYGIQSPVKTTRAGCLCCSWRVCVSPGSRLLTLWTNSYLVATLGDPTLEVVKRHVENLPNT